MATTLFTAEQNAIREMAAAFAQEVLWPCAAAREAAGGFESGLIGQLADLGFLGMRSPVEWGGVGCDTLSYALALIELAAGDGAVSTMISVHNAPVCALIATAGNDEQKAKFLRPLAEGQGIGAFALTEPDAGSDAAALKMRARAVGGGYVLDGTKQFITSGKIARTCIAFAVTDPAAGKKGISAFLVPTDSPGYQVTRLERKMGQKASDTATLRFEGLELPAENRLGAEGEGLKLALSGLEGGRIGIAAQSVGMARRALEIATDYAGGRKTFGVALLAHQAVAFRLADAWTRLEAATQMVLHAARLKDAGLPCLREACMAKLFASETAEAVCSAAMQTLGGAGYIEDYGVERITRDVRVCQIYEGTSDVQKILISRSFSQ